MAQQAKEFLAALNANVDAWYADRIDYKTFGARQQLTWDAIRSSGTAVEELVLTGLREQLAAHAARTR
jgi:hypothetical protein